MGLMCGLLTIPAQALGVVMGTAASPYRLSEPLIDAICRAYAAGEQVRRRRRRARDRSLAHRADRRGNGTGPEGDSGANRDRVGSSASLGGIRSSNPRKNSARDHASASRDRVDSGKFRDRVDSGNTQHTHTRNRCVLHEADCVPTVCMHTNKTEVKDNLNVGVSFCPMRMLLMGKVK